MAERCETMKVVEMFSGAGGMSLGLIQSGMTIHGSYEIMPPMKRVYEQNIYKLQNCRDTFSNIPAHNDMSRYPEILQNIAERKPTLIAGGPPCQDFSSAGKRVEGKRAQLTAFYSHVLCTIRPEWFILENVRGAVGSKQFGIAKKFLKNAGYGLTEHVLWASQYGTPQKRRRLILIGRLGEVDGFLSSALLAAASTEHMSVRQALGDRFGEAMYFHPRDPSRKALWSTDAPAPTIRSASGRNPPQGFVGRPDIDDVVTREYYNPDMEELALLQGFPDWWDWSGVSKGAKSVMIGNAVPPPLAAALGRCIMDRHFGRSIPDIHPGFDDYLKAKGYSPATIRNTRSRINAGRRLLLGRTFHDAAKEMGELEIGMDSGNMSVKAKSDIRICLRKYREFNAQIEADRIAAVEARRSTIRADERARRLQREATAKTEQPGAA